MTARQGVATLAGTLDDDPSLPTLMLSIGPERTRELLVGDRA